MLFLTKKFLLFFAYILFEVKNHFWILLVLMPFPIKLIGFNVFPFGLYIIKIAFNIVKQFKLRI